MIANTLTTADVKLIDVKPDRATTYFSLASVFGLTLKKDIQIQGFASPGILTPEINPNYKFPVEETVIFLMALQLKDNIYLKGHSGTGKAQPLDSKILTPTGWIYMRDVVPGTELCTPSGKVAKVLSIHPQGTLPVYSVSLSDGSKAESCLNHLWKTQTAYERSASKSSVKKLSDIMNNLKCHGHHNQFIENTNSVFFIPKKVRIDPYVLGVLLGDGSFRSSNIRLTCEDKEIVDFVSNNIPGDKVVQDSEIEYRIIRSSRNNLRSVTRLEVEAYGLDGTYSPTKFIPKDYIYNEPEVRLAVLRGLMDTDGYVNPNGSSTVFYSTSFQLACDVQEIVRSLGGKATLTEKTTTYTYKDELREGKTCYCVHINISVCPFRLTRKVSRWNASPKKYAPVRTIRNVEYSREAECQCIYLDDDDHMYITDNYIPTHNTELARQIAARLNYNVVQVNFDGHLLRSDLVGDMRLTNGNTHFRYGLVPYGFMEPGTMILLDEVDAVAPETAFVLQRAVSEDRAFFLNETSELIKLHPQNVIVATANTNGMGDDSGLYLGGTNVQNFSFLNRWGTTITVDYIPMDHEQAMLANMFPDLAESTIEGIVKVMDASRKAFKSDSVSVPLTTRDSINWARKMRVSKLPMRTAKYSFLNRMPVKDAMQIAQIIQRAFKLDASDDRTFLGTSNTKAKF